jgi:hypothetical protein
MRGKRCLEEKNVIQEKELISDMPRRGDDSQ